MRKRKLYFKDTPPWWLISPTADVVRYVDALRIAITRAYGYAGIDAVVYYEENLYRQWVGSVTDRPDLIHWLMGEQEALAWSLGWSLKQYLRGERGRASLLYQMAGQEIGMYRADEYYEMLTTRLEPHRDHPERWPGLVQRLLTGDARDEDEWPDDALEEDEYGD